MSLSQLELRKMGLRVDRAAVALEKGKGAKSRKSMVYLLYTLMEGRARILDLL